MSTPRPLIRAAVLVDLQWSTRAGGHVKTWERLAHAALGYPAEVDLTIFAQGETIREESLGANVRIVMRPPKLSSHRIKVLQGLEDPTDLAPWHGWLFRRLGDFDVIHTTDAYFGYARTARWAARLKGIPTVTSLHTDIPGLTRTYAPIVIERAVGWVPGISRTLEPEAIGAFFGRRMEARLADHCRAAARTLVPVRKDEPPDAMALLSQANNAPIATSTECTSVLRRGIDRKLFGPHRDNRERLESELGIPTGAKVVLYAGRLSAGKRVMMVAEAVERLIDGEVNVFGIFCGEGPEREHVEAILGPRARCLGHVSQADLGWLMATSDVLAFPSAAEVAPNVVLEAKASGLPALVAQAGRRHVIDGEDGLYLGDDVDEWVSALQDFLANDALRERLAHTAAENAHYMAPTWDEVFAEDILAVWHEVVSEHRGPNDHQRQRRTTDE